MALSAASAPEVTYLDLTKSRRMLLLVLVSIGSSAIYTPIYLKSVFYDPLMDALGCTNEQLGTLVTVYAIAATVFYFFSGVVADKFRVRTLSWIGYAGTAALTFLYALLPSYNLLLCIFFTYAVFSILIWWGTRFKMVRLLYPEEAYSQKIGVSYGIFGAAGLVLGVAAIPLVASFASARMGITALLVVCGCIQLLLAVLSFIFIPRFKGEIGLGDGERFSLKGIGEALKNPGVWWASGAMFFIYFAFIGSTFTTPYMTMCLAAPVLLATVISTVRSMGMTIVSAPLFGAIADKVKSPSKVIIIGAVASALCLGAMAFLPHGSGMLIVGVALICVFAFVINGISPSKVIIIGAVASALCLGAMAFLPHGSGMLIVGVALICVFAFVINGIYGIGSGQLAECHVPIGVFGVASGLCSIVGRLPDTFIHTWFGSMIDAQGAAAFGPIFLIIAASCLFGVASGLCSIVGRLPDTFIHTWFGSMIDAQGAAAFGPIFLIIAASCLAAGFCSIMVIRCAKRAQGCTQAHDGDCTGGAQSA